MNDRVRPGRLRSLPGRTRCAQEPQHDHGADRETSPPDPLTLARTKSGRFQGVISPETSRSSEEPTISRSLDNASRVTDSARPRYETLLSSPCASGTREPTSARTGANAVTLFAGGPYHPGRQVPSNTPSSDGWTVFEKASIRWRIDLLVSTKNLADKAVEAYVERAASHAERWSDHAPVTAAFDFGAN